MMSVRLKKTMSWLTSITDKCLADVVSDGFVSSVPLARTAMVVVMSVLVMSVQGV